MKHIAVDGNIYRLDPRGGIARYWAELLRAIALLAPPFRCHLLLPPNSVPPAGISSCNRLSVKGRAYSWGSDVYHTSYYMRWPRMDDASVVTAYDFIDASYPLLRPDGEAFVQRQMEAIRHASFVIAISQTTHDLVLELTGIDTSKLAIAYPGVSEPFRQPIPSEESLGLFREKRTGGAPYLLHVGGRRNYKNFGTLIRAFCACAHKTDRHLMVLGGGYPLSEEEMHLIVSRRLLDRVHFRPRVDDHELRLAYAGADALVHASLMEGFGIPVIEALACGTGLVLSDIPVYREIAADFAKFVDPFDVEAWSQAMTEPVATNRAWRDTVLSRYTWEAAAREHIRVYGELLR